MTVSATKGLPKSPPTAFVDGPDAWASLSTKIAKLSQPSLVIDLQSVAIVAANPQAREAFEILADAPLPLPLDSAMPALMRLQAMAEDERYGFESIADSARTHRVALVFWANGRTIEQSCTVQQLNVDDDLRRVTRLVLVQLANDKTDDEVSTGEPIAVTINAVTFDDADLSATANANPYVNGHAVQRDDPDALPRGDPDALPPAFADALSRDDLASTCSAPEPSNHPPPIARNDAETLKEIARRIREGGLQAARQTTSHIGDPENTIEQPSLTAPAESAADNAATVALNPSDVARLAHELKTPLTAIVAAAEIMRDERLGSMGNARYLGYAADVHDSAHHALAVIAKMLGREPDAIDDDNRIGLIDLNALVVRTVSTLQPLADERRLTLAFDAEDATPIVTANATALRQILINLITNALKFTPPGGDVRVVTGYRETGAAFLVVRDTGIGIDHETAERALSGANANGEPPLEQRPGGGYGIGLPLVVRLVRDLGGEIEIDSAVGRGTVVLVSFVR